ncbi:hypothetical protein [Roseicella sp. DB1501]|uniref:hypothetical protein n=1 Tax=Roseicella sp. DB1501 TaxID=2730925 RepID=UPI0014927172|nr:hypothetical protein [Roseicella sp. DB1501]NOG71965.1 hypothetical protein [Roseicella sp. DB1501]
MATLFSHSAAAKIAQAFGAVRAKESWAEAQYIGLSIWLEWIYHYDWLIETDRGAVQLISELRIRLAEGDASQMDPAKFRRICDCFGEYLAFSEDTFIARQTDGSRKGILSGLSAFLQSAGPVAGFPPLSWPGIKFPKSTPRWLSPTTPTLAEITRRGRVDWSNPDDATTAVLEDAASIERALSLQSKLEAIGALNTARLAALRRALEVELEEAYKTFQFGRELLSDSTIEPPELDLRRSDLEEHKCITRWLEKQRDASAERQLGGILKYLVATSSHGVMRLPGRILHQWMAGSELFRREFSLIRSIQGERYQYKKTLQAFISLVPESWNAALGILLIDTAWNLQPLLNLPVKCFIGSRTADGKYVVASTKLISELKDRGGHDVTAVLAQASPDDFAKLRCEPLDGQKLSGCRVIELVQEMTSVLRSSGGAGRLLICALPNKSGQPTGDARLWQEFLDRPAAKGSPEISGLPITRRMIRKTCIDIEAARHDGDHGPAQLRASHARGSTTMSHYLRTPWFQRALTQNIRRFQQILEAAFLADLPEVAKSLGISEEELLASKDLANETGLGFVCLRPFAGIQPGTNPGVRCHRVDRCHLGCPARRFVPNASSVLALLLANRSLRAVEAAWIAANPERWEAVWMPFMAETEAYIERLKESSFRSLLHRAEDALQAALGSGTLALIELW